MHVLSASPLVKRFVSLQTSESSDGVMESIVTMWRGSDEMFFSWHEIFHLRCVGTWGGYKEELLNHDIENLPF